MSTNTTHFGIDHAFVQSAIRKARRERSETIWRLLRGEPLDGLKPTKPRFAPELYADVCAAHPA